MSDRVLRRRYALLQELGRSPFAVTHLAHDRERDRRCVVKLLSLRRADGPKVHELFEREAAVLARLEHPRIPRFLDFFTEETGDDLLVVLVQEHVEGVDLFRLVQGGRRFTEPQIVDLGVALARILEYLHGLPSPVLHRDIKPSNVLLGADGSPWLVDFGSVRDKVRHEPELAPGGPTVVGSFGYMPLEQAQGDAVAASDVAALAATLVFLASGREPWEFEKRGLGIVLRGVLPVSERLLRALEQALEPDWRRRTPTACAFREALEASQRPQSRRAPAIAAALALALGLAAGVALRDPAPAPIPRPAPTRAETPVAALPAGVSRLGLPAFQHGGPVRAVAFLPGDAVLLSAADDATLSAWSLPAGQELWRLRLGSPARALAVTGGPTPRIAVATSAHEPVWLLDIEGHAVARLVTLDTMAFREWSLAFDAAGATLVTATPSGRLDLWRSVDGSHLASVRPCGTPGTVRVAALSEGGFAAACEGRGLAVLDGGLAVTRRLEKSFPAAAIVALPAPHRVGLLAREGSFVDLDVVSGVERRTELPRGEWLESAVASPDGRQLALGQATGATVVVDLASGRRIHAFEGLSGRVHAVAFSADGTRLASAGDDHRVSVWSLTGGSIKSPPGPPKASRGGISALAFGSIGFQRRDEPGAGPAGAPSPTELLRPRTPDAGFTLYAASPLGELRAWGLDGRVLGNPRGLGGPIVDLGFLGDGRLVAAVGSRQARYEEATRRLVVVDEAGTSEVTLPVDARGLALLGERGAVTGGATRLDRWDLGTGTRTSWSVPLPERPVAASVDGRAFATLRDAPAVRGRYILVLRDGRTGAELAAAGDREGGPFAVACSGARADHVLHDGRLWRVVGLPQPGLLALGTAFGNLCAVSADGRWLALRERPWGSSASDAGERVLLHEIPSPPAKSVSPLKLVAVLGGHRGPVNALAFSPDSRVLASGGAEGSVLLWQLDVVRDELARRGSLSWPAASAAEEAVWSLGFEEADPGGLRLATDAAGVEWGPGVVGRALLTERGLRVEGPAAPVTTGEWTFAGWFSVGGAAATRSHQAILASPFVSLDLRSGQPMLFLHFATGGHASVALSEWTGPWAAATWHHLAVVRARDGSSRICVDATCGPGPSGSPFSEAAGPILLGPQGAQVSDRLGFDDLRLYTRALGDAELALEARTSHVRPRPTATPPPRPRGAPALEATPEPRLPLDVTPLVVRESQADFEVLRFTGLMASLELFDVEVGGGRVWVATSRGLLEHDPARGYWRLHGKAAGLPGERLSQIAFVAGRVVVDAMEITRPGIGERRGSHVFDPATDRFTPFDLGSGMWHLSGEGDQVWIGRSTGAEVRPLSPRAAVLLEAAPGRTFTKASGALQHDVVYRIVPRADSVWFASMGTWQKDPKGKAPGDGFFLGGGVSMWDRARDRFQRWGVEAGLADGYCSGIAVDDAEAWVAHFREDRGVSRLDRKTGRWQAFHTGSNGEKLGGISVALSGDHVWIGSQNGLIQLDRRSLVARRFDHRQRLPGHILYGIAEGLGALWVTTHGTANREPEGWRTQAGLLRIPLPRQALPQQR